jgi:hypothetical protein
VASVENVSAPINAPLRLRISGSVMAGNTIGQITKRAERGGVVNRRLFAIAVLSAVAAAIVAGS